MTHFVISSRQCIAPPPLSIRLEEGHISRRFQMCQMHHDKMWRNGAQKLKILIFTIVGWDNLARSVTVILQETISVSFLLITSHCGHKCHLQDNNKPETHSLVTIGHRRPSKDVKLLSVESAKLEIWGWGTWGNLTKRARWDDGHHVYGLPGRSSGHLQLSFFTCTW